MKILILIFSLYLSYLSYLSCMEIIEKGDSYTIYYPFQDVKTNRPHSLLAPPHYWVDSFYQKLETLKHLVEIESEIKNTTIYSRDMYIQTLLNYVVGDYLGNYEKTIIAKLKYKGRLPFAPLDNKRRQEGKDWSMFGITMTGRVRLLSIKDMIIDVIKNNIEGDFIETGVWRGGMSIFMRGVALAYGQGHRISYVCDSFSGLPPSVLKLDRASWDNTPYLEVSDVEVKNNFVLSGIHDPKIIFVKGFFAHTMKPLSKIVEKVSILRLDGDMYESTVDVLYHFYDKLSIGGYVIIDDFSRTFPARDACEHFFKVHKIQPNIITPDTTSGYWKKTENVEIQYWRYVQKKFYD